MEGGWWVGTCSNPRWRSKLKIQSESLYDCNQNPFNKSQLAAIGGTNVYAKAPANDQMMVNAKRALNSQKSGSKDVKPLPENEGA